MKQFLLIPPLAKRAKGHEMWNKGNSVEPFVYRGLRDGPRARKIKCWVWR